MAVTPANQQEDRMADAPDALLDGEGTENLDELPVEGDGGDADQKGGEVEVDPEIETPDDQPAPDPKASAEPAAETPEEPAKKGGPDSGWKAWRKTQKENELLTQRLADYDRQMQETRDQLQRIQQLQQQPARQADPGPQPGQPFQWTPQALAQLAEEDPIQYNRVLAELSYQASQQAAQQQQVIQTQMMVQGQINEFKSRTPDYNDAIRHLELKETERLRASGLAEAQIPEMIQFRASQLMQIALQSGKNVGELAYAVAKADGWVSPAEQAAAAAPVKRGPSPEQKVAASRAKSQQAAASVANAPGSATGSIRVPESLEELERLTEKDLDDLDDKIPGWQDRFLHSA